MAARREVNPISHTPNKLKVDKENFKKDLEDRIEKGKLLLLIDVPVISTGQHIGYALIRQVQYQRESCEEFTAAYSKWSDYNSELLKQAFDSPENEYRSAYLRESPNTFWGEDIVGEHKSAIQNQITNLESLIDKLPLIPIMENTTISAEKTSMLTERPIANNRLFIVHGHDSGTKNEVARFLENLGLVAIILHEQVNQGRTIIEKIEEYSDVGFGIILYTPCDLGASVSEKDNLNPRARQNVVFEHGYLIAKIGRKRVCALVKDTVETPGDISGVVYILKDNDNAWKYKIALEMKAVGYNIDMNNIR